LSIFPNVHLAFFFLLGQWSLNIPIEDGFNVLGNGSVSVYTLGVHNSDEDACMRMHTVQEVGMAW
jgi:hypothetical protein